MLFFNYSTVLYVLDGNIIAVSIISYLSYNDCNCNYQQRLYLWPPASYQSILNEQQSCFLLYVRLGFVDKEEINFTIAVIIKAIFFFFFYFIAMLVLCCFVHKNDYIKLYLLLIDVYWQLFLDRTYELLVFNATIAFDFSICCLSCNYSLYWIIIFFV